MVQIDGRIFKHANTGLADGELGISPAAVLLALPKPVGVVGGMVVGFWVGHQAEDTAGGVADTGDIGNGSVGIVGKPAGGRLPVGSGVLHGDLVRGFKPGDDIGPGIKFSFPMAHGQIDTLDAFRKDTWRAIVDSQPYPLVSKIATIVVGHRRETLGIVAVEPGK